MAKALFFCGVMMWINGFLHGQVMEGIVSDANSSEPLPFVIIVHSGSGKGTLANEEGYFRITANPGDTLTFSFIGYETKRVRIEAGRTSYDVELLPAENMLNEIVVNSRKGEFWIAEFEKCKKAVSHVKHQAKAYMEVKSFRDGQQTELIQSYYNADITGYKVNGLHVKSGRVGLQPYHNNFFVSLESSKAMIFQGVFEPGITFPFHPLQLTPGQNRKLFSFYLDHEYTDESGKKVSVVGYEPLDTTGHFFYGRIWLSAEDHQLVKMTFECPVAKRHPFLPMFQGDRIADVSLHITRTFQRVGNKSVFHYTDFTYDIQYISREDSPDQDSFSIQTKAILYAYDLGDEFVLPYMSSGRHDMQDYRLYSSMPYNHFFWDNHDEYMISYAADENETFMRDTSTVLHQNIFGTNDYFKQGFYEHPFIPWSTSRISIRQREIKTLSINGKTTQLAPEYVLVPDFFMDYNRYRGITNVLTCVQMDPYRSYVGMPMDPQWLCFINMYFDLCEIQRRKMAEDMEPLHGNPDQLRTTFEKWMSVFEKERSIYLKKVKEGDDINAMKEYNQLISDQLGIDNMALFPYNSETTVQNKKQ